VAVNQIKPKYVHYWQLMLNCACSRLNSDCASLLLVRRYTEGCQAELISICCIELCREDQELEAEAARLQAEIDDEQKMELEGDFPAIYAPQSKPHVDDEDQVY